MSKLSNLTYKEAVIKPYKDNFFYTTEELNFSWEWEKKDVGFCQSHDNIYYAKIPKGFITDLSSCYRVPILGKTIFKTNTCNQSLAVLHDYLCSRGAIISEVMEWGNWSSDKGRDSFVQLYTMTKQSEADDVLCEALKYQYNLYNGKDNIGASPLQARLIRKAISLVKWRKDPVRIYNEQKQREEI